MLEGMSSLGHRCPFWLMSLIIINKSSYFTMHSEFFHFHKCLFRVYDSLGIVMCKRGSSWGLRKLTNNVLIFSINFKKDNPNRWIDGGWVKKKNEIKGQLL